MRGHELTLTVHGNMIDGKSILGESNGFVMQPELNKVEGCGGLGGVRLIWGDKEVTMQYLVLKGGDRGACKLLGDVMVMQGRCLRCLIA
ncbi:hypothetical protein Tco_0983907 [Tanacetum coccineum]